MKVTWMRNAAIVRMTARALPGAALLLLGGCLEERVAGTTGVGNPPQSQAVFSMVAGQGPAAVAKASAAGAPAPGAAADTAFAVTDKGGTRFVLRSAHANIGQVKFKLPEGLRCAETIEQECEEDALKVEGPFVADLMTGGFTPAFPAFNAPHGTYTRVDVRLESLEHGKPVPDSSLAGHSMVLSGTFAYGGRTDREFRIILDFDEEARFDSGAMEVREQSLNRLVLRLDVDAWLAQADITRCLDDGGLILDVAGNLRIDEDNACEGLEHGIKEGIKASGDLDEEHEEREEPDETDAQEEE